MGSPFLLYNDSQSFRAGNIASRLDVWAQVTGDPWVLEQVVGVKIPLWDCRLQDRVPFPYRLGEEERQVVDEEVLRLLSKQVLEPVAPEPGQFISNVFLRPKSDGKFRMILDLTELNKQIPYEHFKMTSLNSALEMMRPGCWMASVDLRDAYYSVPVAGQFRKLLRFYWRNALFQFTALPNGLACAPRVFTKLLAPVYANLHMESHECFPYIDDSFVVGDSWERCRETVVRLCTALDQLGFYIHLDKSVLVPTQRLTFLGFELDSKEMSVTLTQEKKDKFARAAVQLLSKQRPTVREVAGLVGLMTAYSPAVEYGGAHIKRLEQDKNLGLKLNKGNFDGKMTVSEQSVRDITWWLEHVQSAKKWVRGLAPEIEIATDASLDGWGGHRGETQAGGRWAPEEITDHINVLELRAISLALKSLVSERGVHVKILTDNTTALAYVKHMGGVRSESCDTIAKEIWQWAEDNYNWLSIAHIPGVENVVADYLSRNFSDEVEWSLSDSIFAKVCKVYGTPEVDLFASRLNTKLGKYVAWGPDPGAWKIDAFTLDWSNYDSYIFPPFSLLGRVLRKIRSDGARATLVAPDWPGQPWYGTLMAATKRRLFFRGKRHNLKGTGRMQDLDWLSRLPLVVCRF